MSWRVFTIFEMSSTQTVDSTLSNNKVKCTPCRDKHTLWDAEGWPAFQENFLFIYLVAPVTS